MAAWAEANPEADDTNMWRAYAWIAWPLSSSDHAFPGLTRMRTSPPFSPDDRVI